jgi:transposase
MPLRRNSQPPRRVIEPLFPIPDGLEDLVYDGEPAEDELWFDVDEDDSDPATKHKKKKKKKKHKKKKQKGKKKHKHKKKKGKKHKKKKDDDKGKDHIRSPKTFRIAKQIMRTKADGSQVVDVTVEVDKIARADKYEFRLTKKDTGKTTVITG